MNQVVLYDLLELSDDDKGVYQNSEGISRFCGQFPENEGGTYVWSSLAPLIVVGDARRRRYRRTEVNPNAKAGGLKPDLGPSDKLIIASVSR